MMSRALNVAIGIVLALSAAMPADAQKTKSQLTTEVGTTFPDQTTGQITPSGVRTFQNDVINSIMPTAPVGNGNFAAFDGTTGLLKDSGISSSSQFVANANIIPGTANTVKGSLDGAATSDIALTACSLTYQVTKWVSGTGWQCGLNPVLPSRAVAASLDLSAFNAITTQSYAKPGDGGGATFYKRNTAILGYAIGNAGSCNNGTWPGIRLTGGTGSGAYGTLTISGGVATNFTLQGSGAQGNGYTAGDVLTVSDAGNVVCVTYPTITVNTVGNGTFIDSGVTSTTINTAGTGCTDNTYYGVTPQDTVTSGGGFGDRLQGNVVISGGALTSFTIAVPGGGYQVGDLLNFVNPNTTTQITGCATQPVIRVAATSTPRGSFTDAAGANWQILAGNNLNVLQFGAVADYNWLMPDADATDNGPAFRAAMEFTAVGNGPADARGYGGSQVFVPKGSYLICGGVIQYEYVTLRGAGFGASMLKQCNSDGATASLITQGTPLARVGNFAANTWDLTLYGSASGTGPVIYSNNNQSGDAISRVAIYPAATNRTCVKYEIGYGGQSMYGIHNVICVPVSGSPAFDLSGNFGFVIDGETMIASILTVGKGFRFGDGGVAHIGPGVHCEGTVTACISVNGSGSSPPLVTVQGASGPATNLVYIETGTPANTTAVINTLSNGSTCTVYMQATASCAKTGNQLGLATY